jgi:hypothetical protein
MVHAVTAFSRWENLSFYLDNIPDTGVIWHPIFLEDECKKEYEECLNKPWIQKYTTRKLPINQNPCKYKLNMFLVEYDIVEQDKYFFMNDDDWFDTSIVQKIDAMDDDVIFVSMKRGHNSNGGHPSSPLIVSPDVHIGTIGIEQYFLKGKIMKQVRFRTDFDLSTGYPPHRQGDSDGHLAEMLMKLYPVRYEPDLYVYFNYLEPGRWRL